MTTANAAAAMTRADTKTLSLLVAAQVLLFMIPLVVLGRAIGWPASLRMSPADVLPLFAREALAVQIGYWGYLATTVAMVPLVMALRRWAQTLGITGLALDCMVAFGVAAAIAKSLGIVRWLLAMPGLATRYIEAGDPVRRAAVEVSYETLNVYAGSVGELLGVQLFSGLWLLSLGLVLRRVGFPTHGWAALALGTGFVACAMRTLIPPLEALQSVMPPLALAWLSAFAVAIWRWR